MLLTDKQTITLKSIKSYKKRHGKMPTIKELMLECKNYGLKVKSPRSISLFLEKLEKKGFIKRTGQERGIILINAKDDLNNSLYDVPIYGIANAGSPTQIAEQQLQGYLKVSNELIKNNKVFSIKVSGTSMDKAIVGGKRINSGDYVIVDAEDKNFQNNDRVLITIDGLATIKKFKRLSANKIGLFPESSDSSHKPIYITNKDCAVINGKIIDVFPASDDYISSDDEPVYEYL